MKFKSVLLGAFGLLAAQSCALAGSTINPNVPATNAPLNSGPVRQNFTAAFNDINNLQTRSAASSQPAGLATFQDWANTTGCPTACAITMFDGTQPVQWGLLNQTTHAFTPNVGPGAVVGTAPITANISGGVATIGIANGTSIVNPGTGTIEAVLPIQTAAGTNKAFLTTDLFKETRRSNSGSAMADTFPASTATGMVSGAKITITNVDATASDTITGGAGTTISGTNIVGPGRAIQYVYDLANTTWRPTLNTAAALLGPNNLSDLSSIATARSNLGLGSAALQNIGTSGANVPLLNGANAWGAAQTIPGLTVTGSFTATGLVTSADLANTAVTAGAYGSATASPTFTVNAQGQLTTAANVTITPALGSITGFGTGVEAAAAIALNGAGGLINSSGAIASALTGFTSGAGTITATDSILTAFQKINGNDLAKLPLAGGTMSGNIGGNFSLTGNIAFGGTITAGSLPTSGTIAGSLCPTSTGLILNIAGANCFGSGAATSVAATGTTGATTVTGATTGNLLYYNGSFLANETVAALLAQGASTNLSDTVAATTFTPTDGSGSSLSFTAVTGNYGKINKTCTGDFRVTYPSTASTSAASIMLPAACTAANNGNNAVGACFSGAAAPNGTLIALMVANSNSMVFINTTGGLAETENTNLSTFILSCHFAFTTAS